MVQLSPINILMRKFSTIYSIDLWPFKVDSGKLTILDIHLDRASFWVSPQLFKFDKSEFWCGLVINGASWPPLD